MRKGIVLLCLVGSVVVCPVLWSAADSHMACSRSAGWMLSMIITENAHAFPQTEPSEGMWGYGGSDTEDPGYGVPVPRYDDSGEIGQMERDENADEESESPYESYDEHQQQEHAGYGESEDAFEDPEQEPEDIPDIYYQNRENDNTNPRR